MTKKEMFTGIRNIVEHAEASAFVFNGETVTVDDVLQFIDHEIELLSRKRSTGNNKAKAETEVRAERVYNALAEMEEPVTISDFLKLTSDEEVAGYTNQRISALFRKLGDKVMKEMKGKKAYFSVA